MSTFLPVDQQMELLSRGVVDFINPDELRERLKEGRPLRVKCGFDPTAPDLHVGHTVVLQKMRQFQMLGHTVIFLIGDFTGRIGDPTGKNETRKVLTKEDVDRNAETYKRQVFKILDPERTVIDFNSRWMEAMSASGLVRLASTYTVARILEREDFRNRLKHNLPISVHEFLYPVIQGYDSVALEADVELGGHDQIFNLLVGRVVQKEYGLRSQIVMTVPLLEGTDAKLVDGVLTGAKMSKSLGNYIGIAEPAEQMFGKVMSISDELMWKYFELLSDVPPDELKALKAGAATGQVNPRDVKVRLGQELVARYHSQAAAEEAAAGFDRVFRQHSLPQDMEEVTYCLAELEGKPFATQLAMTGSAASSREARRLIEQGAVKVDQQRIGLDYVLPGQGTYVIQAGKRVFRKLVVR
jgi:tyrosyl-tRNA synthetase